MDWKMRIGIEIHAQIISKKKIFSFAPVVKNDNPNVNTDLFDTGMPGSLPVVNHECVFSGIKTALALKCYINPTIAFDRKHYRYPDLPAGYQLTQFYKPVGLDGHVQLSNGAIINIERLHLESDAGKLIKHNGASYCDFNRSGVGLMEIVSAPDIYSSDDAVEYLRLMRAILMTVGTCDGNLEDGSMRCDVNLSIFRDINDEQIPIEIKNINSPRFVKTAIEYEFKRQVTNAKNDIQEKRHTRSFDAQNKTTEFMRYKESASDYMYYPDTNLQCISIAKEDIDAIRASLPMMPYERIEKYQAIGLGNDDAVTLSFDPILSSYMDHPDINDIKHFGQFLANIFNGIRSDNDVIDPRILIDVAGLLQCDKITNTAVKKLLRHVMDNNIQYDDFKNAVIKEYIVTDSVDIDAILHDICNNNPNEVQRYREGEKKLSGWFIGQVMKQCKANPKAIIQRLDALLINSNL